MAGMKFPTEWRGRCYSETECGSGSAVRNMTGVIKRVPAFLSGVQKNHPDPLTVMELGCGDLNFARHTILNRGFQYTGIDLKARKTWVSVKDNPGITLIQGDITQMPSFTADVIIIRDVWIHLPNYMIAEMIPKLRCRWLLTTTYPGADNDKRYLSPNHEYRPLDITKAPFGLTVDEFIPEQARTKFLAVCDEKRSESK